MMNSASYSTDLYNSVWNEMDNLYNYSVLVGKNESLLFCCLVLIFYAYILLF